MLTFNSSRDFSSKLFRGFVGLRSILPTDSSAICSVTYEDGGGKTSDTAAKCVAIDKVSFSCSEGANGRNAGGQRFLERDAGKTDNNRPRKSRHPWCDARYSVVCERREVTRRCCTGWMLLHRHRCSACGGKSVLLRQEQSREAAIGFGNQPKLVTSCCGIGAQKTESVSKTELVFSNIFWIKFAPVSTYVTDDKLQWILVGFGESFDCARSSYDAAGMNARSGRRRGFHAGSSPGFELARSDSGEKINAACQNILSSGFFKNH